MLTVYGIETQVENLVSRALVLHQVATVLTVYGIETNDGELSFDVHGVATVLTVYGIET